MPDQPVSAGRAKTLAEFPKRLHIGRICAQRLLLTLKIQERRPLEQPVEHAVHHRPAGSGGCDQAMPLQHGRNALFIGRFEFRHAIRRHPKRKPHERRLRGRTLGNDTRDEQADTYEFDQDSAGRFHRHLPKRRFTVFIAAGYFRFVGAILVIAHLRSIDRRRANTRFAPAADGSRR